MWKINECEIKYLLKNYKEIQKRNAERLLSLYKEIENEDSMENLISVKTNRFGVEAGGHGGGKYDLGDVLEQVQAMQRRRTLDIREELYQLIEEIEKIDRLIICCGCLGKMDIKGYNIIRRLYMEGELYAVVELEMKATHSVFERTRQKALNTIRQLYESGFSNSEIITKGECGKKQRCQMYQKENFSQMKLECLEVPVKKRKQKAN